MEEMNSAYSGKICMQIVLIQGRHVYKIQIVLIQGRNECGLFMEEMNSAYLGIN